MNTSRLSAGASRFAHFAGLTRGKRGARADQDDQRDDNAEDDDEDKDASEDDDSDEDRPAGRGKKGKGARASSRAAEDDDDDGKDASEDDDDQDRPAGRGKKGKGARAADDDDDDGKDASDDDEDGDDDEKEMKGKGAIASARRREQARITHILSHKAAANNPELALSLACETRMARREAVAVLRSQPQRASEGDRREDRGNRHARQERQERNVSLGGGAGDPSGRQAVSASWDAAWKKAGATPR